jgi:hypothetical protein
VKPLAIVLMALITAAVAACAGSPPPGTDNRGPARLTTRDATPAPAPERQTRLTPPGGKTRLDSLPGMRGTELTTLMGAPQFRRRDGQAEIWQYRGSACTLDVFLYTDGNDLRVRYVEARGRGGTKDAPDSGQARACAASLLDTRAGGAG